MVIPHPYQTVAGIGTSNAVILKDSDKQTQIEPQRSFRFWTNSRKLSPTWTKWKKKVEGFREGITEKQKRENFAVYIHEDEKPIGATLLRPWPRQRATLEATTWEKFQQCCRTTPQGIWQQEIETRRGKLRGQSETSAKSERQGGMQLLLQGWNPLIHQVCSSPRSTKPQAGGFLWLAAVGATAL